MNQFGNNTINTLMVIMMLLSCHLGISQSNYTQHLEHIDNAGLDSLERIFRADYYDGLYDKVIEDGPLLIKRGEELNNSTVIRRIRTSLGNTFVKLGDIEKAQEVYRLSAERAIKEKDTFSLASSYIDSGIALMKLDPKNAVDYFLKASSLSKGDGMEVMLVASGINLAEIYINNEDAVNAQRELDVITPIVENNASLSAHNEILACILFEQGAIHVLQEQYDKAIPLLQRARTVGEGHLQQEVRLNNLDFLIQAYDKSNRFKELNVIRKEYDALRDKQYESDKVKEQQIAIAKYKLDQYEEQLEASHFKQELAEQKASQSKMLSYFGFIIGLILLFFIGLLLYFMRKRTALLKNLRVKNRQYLEAKEKSEQLAQAKTQFLSTMSHELRTPLYGIIGLSSVLIKKPELQGQLDNLKPLKSSADYLLSLINDVLDINKLESQLGQEEVKNTYFELNQLIQTAIQSFAFINEQHNNKVIVTIDKTIPHVLRGDKTKISQVLMNLMSNASKFTQDGTVSVRVALLSQEDNEIDLEFEIQDTGIGIPKEQQATIFDEFTQITNSSEYEGTGLGLPIVNKILKFLNSKLDFESALGKGTLFSFILRLEKGVQADLINLNNQDYEEKLAGKKILIVDDNKINRIVTQKVLDQYGIDHYTANNGKEAIAIVSENKFDVILMDINMPVMNGLDASKAIRDLNIKTPIIALTAMSPDGTGDELSSFGIQGTILKPYDTDQLLDKILLYL